MNTKYGVDFYDMIDGWCHMPDHNPDMRFDNIEAARLKRDEMNSGVDAQNKDVGEGFSVIDFKTSLVVD